MSGGGLGLIFDQQRQKGNIDGDSSTSGVEIPGQHSSFYTSLSAFIMYSIYSPISKLGKVEALGWFDGMAAAIMVYSKTSVHQ